MPASTGLPCTVTVIDWDEMEDDDNVEQVETGHAPRASGEGAKASGS